ncbi:hypothetical protein AGMMS50229_19250 [Campylobacterota bacterium]|nr:hypothetical protein AGMMS50229_19250 [Campylobacterota bacterium]
MSLCGGYCHCGLDPQSRVPVILNEVKNLKTNTDTSATPQYDKATPVILNEVKNLKANTDTSASPQYDRGVALSFWG